MGILRHIVDIKDQLKYRKVVGQKITNKPFLDIRVKIIYVKYLHFLITRFSL